MLLLLIQLVFASFVPRVAAFCGTPPPFEAFKAVHAGFLTQGNQSSVIAIREFKEVNIDTYAHVMTEGSFVAEGNIEDETIFDQTDVINDAFSGSGFALNLVNISRTSRPDWRKTGPETPKESEMKTALRKGSYADLNVYFDTIEGEGILGYAYLPQVFEINGHRGFIIDGIVVDPGSAPGGLIEYYNERLTADPGDYVDDTPVEEDPEELARTGEAVEGCPADRDLSPSLPGKDPVHNYMDYTDNPCQNQFTPGQKKRMQEMWEKYRLKARSTETEAGPVLDPDSKAPNGDKEF